MTRAGRRLIVLGGVGGALILAAWLLPFGRMSTDCAQMTLPDGAHTVRHSRDRIGGLTPEYLRWLAVDSAAMTGEWLPMPMDTGGGYPMDCFWIPTSAGGLLSINSGRDQFLLDPRQKQLYVVVNEDSKKYIGKYDPECLTTWEMIRYGDGTPTVLICGRAAMNWNDFVATEEQVFLGTFYGTTGNLQFAPASSGQQPN